MPGAGIRSTSARRTRFPRRPGAVLVAAAGNGLARARGAQASGRVATAAAGQEPFERAIELRHALALLRDFADGLVEALVQASIRPFNARPCSRTSSRNEVKSATRSAGVRRAQRPGDGRSCGEGRRGPRRSSAERSAWTAMISAVRFARRSSMRALTPANWAESSPPSETATATMVPMMALVSVLMGCTVSPAGGGRQHHGREGGRPTSAVWSAVGSPRRRFPSWAQKKRLPVETGSRSDARCGACGRSLVLRTTAKPRATAGQQEAGDADAHQRHRGSGGRHHATVGPAQGVAGVVYDALHRSAKVVVVRVERQREACLCRAARLGTIPGAVVTVRHDSQRPAEDLLVDVCLRIPPILVGAGSYTRASAPPSRGPRWTGTPGAAPGTARSPWRCRSSWKRTRHTRSPWRCLCDHPWHNPAIRSRPPIPTFPLQAYNLPRLAAGIARRMHVTVVIMPARPPAGEPAPTTAASSTPASITRGIP